MPYEVANRMRQLQNVTIRGEDGRSATLSLMPRGKEGCKRQIPDSAMTPELELKRKKGILKLKKVSEQEPTS